MTPRQKIQLDAQRRLVRWWSHSCVTFSVPESLLVGIAGKCSRLMLAWPKTLTMHQIVEQGHNMRDTAHALFLEFKTTTGRTTAEQQTFHQHLRAAGYRVEIVRSFDQAVEVITGYLSK